jgi:Flp pilus assembly protein TadG
VLARLKRALKREDGQALVELALALPILVLVLLAILDFSRALNAWNSETSLANVAARYLAVGSLPTYGPCANKTTIDQYVTCALQNQYGITQVSSGTNGLSGVSTCVSVPNNANGQPVTVKLTGNYKVLPMLPAISGISGSATMRIEGASIPSTMFTNSASC